MMCDLAEFTALSNALDPEDTREVVRSFLDTSNEVVRQHKGFIARYMGDGMLVYFGYPRAQEDDAERAVHAGLDIVSAVQALRPLPQVSLQVRVGIATGVVVAGDLLGEGASREAAMTGPTPNLAARLQAVAMPGTVVISATTRKLVGNLFDCVDLGRLQLKGFNEPMPAWRVAGARAIESRFDALHPRDSLIPLVGRERELAVLMDRWQLVRGGSGQVALVSGEPGIGKSRLLSALQERLTPEVSLALRFQCSPYYQNSAFYPIIDCLQRMLRFKPDQPAASKLDRIEDILVRRCGRPIKDVQLIAAILSVPAEERHGPLAMTPRRQKDDTIRALLDLIEALGHQQPSLLLFEDAHWADPSTLEVVDQLIGRLARCPLFVVISHRSEFNDTLLAHADVTRLALSRLSHTQSAAIVSRLVVGKALPPNLLEHIVARTDGVPLFVEELTKAILESSTLRDAGDRYEYSAARGSMLIPATLRDSLMARLDRSPIGKVIAQIGAVIGREFSYALVSAVAPVSKPDLDRALEGLTKSGLMFARHTATGRTYTFKHALVQETAHDSLLKSTRQDLHGKIAHVLEERFPETAQAHPELLAHHYTEAALFKQAVDYWKLAGDHAAQRSANLEAVNHLERGLLLVKFCPDGPERKRQELELYATLGRVLIAIKGYASPEVEQTFALAHELFPYVPDSAQKFVVLRGECQLLLVQARYDAARARADELASLADQEPDSAYRLDAHLMIGLIDLYQGRFGEAREHLERCVEMYDPRKHLGHAILQGVDIGSACLAYLARTLWFLGYPDTALQRSTEAVMLAQTPSIPLGIAQASGMLALVHQVQGNLTATKEWVDKTIRYAKEQGHAYWLALGGVLDSWLRAHAGQTVEAVDEIARSIQRYQGTGARLGLSWFLLLQAEAHQQVGQHAQGLAALADALRHIDDTGETYYAAEAQRRKGELLLARSRAAAAAEAEACFRHALEIAKGQQARSWELRAATSLARLWNAQGRRAQAYDLLAGIHAGFTEGLDTADLQEAEALLRELNPSTPGQLARVVDQGDKVIRHG
jgi:class 3 adenylate cyclase/predicted ATPase